MRHIKVTLSLCLCALSLPTSIANAQTAPAPDPALADMQREIDQLKKEKDLLSAQKDLATEQKALNDAKINALGLPEFKTDTTLSANAGKLEAMLLGSAAIREAADVIREKMERAAADKSTDRPIVLLAGDEAPPWRDALTVQALVTFHNDQLKLRMAEWKDGPIAGLDAGLAISAVTAAAKLFGQETTVSPVDFTASDDLLLRSLAAGMKNARQPGALLFVEADSPLLKEFGSLQANLAKAASIEKKGKGPQLTDLENRLWEALQSELTASKELTASLTKPGSDGSTPLFVAARYAKLLDGNALVATVHSDFAGGSAVSTKNIATFFGADPLRISGGLVASYTLTDPKTGQVLSAGIIPCRTTYTRFRTVQADNWGRDDALKGKLCLRQ